MHSKLVFYVIVIVTTGSSVVEISTINKLNAILIIIILVFQPNTPVQSITRSFR